jgi:hypothetical protein
MVAKEHGQAGPRAQGRVREPVATGPRPEVLARLAEGVDTAAPTHPRSEPARILGLILCVAIAALVVGIALIVGYP